MHKTMRIGTRKSELALAQTRLFIEECQKAAPQEDISYEIVKMSTAGDAVSDKPLYEFAGKGMFVSAFEEALLSGRIDVAVHSGKDMPGELSEGLVIGGVLQRGNPGDVLVTLPGTVLKKDSVIGTGSLRRQEQVKNYLDCRVTGIRGNVGTRLKKLREAAVDGLILAAAGLERLGYLEKEQTCLKGTFLAEGISYCYERLSEQKFLPAAAQGIIAIECREDCSFQKLLETVSHKETMCCLLAERAYLAKLGAGCQQPVAAFSYCADEQIFMEAGYWKNGRELRVRGGDALTQAAALGTELAARILQKADASSGLGQVFLVGAGPGDAGLITVKGQELLQSCDVVVYDRLCGEALLDKVRPDCQRIYVGKQAGGDSIPQQEINDILVKKAQEGKLVVRLKGGDPFVFGRGGEEAERLQAEGISVTAVPGVTSAVAAPELAGIPVTHRKLSRSFHVITAHTSEKSQEKQEAYLRQQIAGLERAEGTLVFLMGLSVLDTICRLLTEYGRGADTPAAVISSGSLQEQTAVRGTLADIAQRVKEKGVISPAVIIVGETASLSLGAAADALQPKQQTVGCETDRVLSGIRIGIVGTKRLWEKLSGKLRMLGAEPLWVQEQQIEPLEGQEAYFAELDAYTWIVFTSAYGVECFFYQLACQKKDIRELGTVKIAVIGPGTAQALEQYCLQADFIPECYTAQALADGMMPMLTKADRVLLYQAKEGSPVIRQMLSDKGIAAVWVSAYETRAGAAAREEVLEMLDYLVFASGSGVRAFCGKHPGIFSDRKYSHLRFAAIGSSTQAAMEEAGCRESFSAKQFTAEGLAEAIRQDGKERYRK